MLWIIIAIISSYLVGSLPTAFIFGRILKGIDIRNYGSGNVGATNAMRVLGKGPGITVLFLDIIKGFVVVVFLANLVSAKISLLSGELLRIILGVSCICGHNWSIFLGCKGGKGMAATLGVLLGLAIKIVGLRIALGSSIIIWLIVFTVTRIVSIASVMSGISLPIFMLLFKQSHTLIFLSILLCLLVILRHKSNLRRVFQGKERPLF